MRDDQSNERSDDRDFCIPFRCLIPPDAVGSIVGKGAVALRSLVQDTGVEVQVLKSDENPRGLEDRLVIMNGSERSKEKALSWLLNKLRDHFRKRRDDVMTFVTLVPGAAIPAIIGNRGSCIRDISDRSRAELDVSKDRLRGTSDTALTIKGKSDHIHAAMTLVERVLVYLRDKGELVKRDFTFCKIFPRNHEDHPPSVKPTPAVADNFVSGIPVRLVVTSDGADFLTSKTGAVEAVKSLESKFNCLITIEETMRIKKKEIVKISADTFGDKWEATAGILKLLATDHSVEILAPVELNVSAISKSTGCTFSTEREGEGAIIRVDSGSQMEAVKLLLSHIDSSGVQRREADSKCLVVHIPPNFPEERLNDLRTKMGCNFEFTREGLIELKGSKTQIIQCVDFILSVDITKETSHMDIDRRRIDEEEVDYSY